MPTRTDPFDPRGPLSREQLARYVRGELDDAERHEVERHIERDELVREAVDGLELPGAITGLGSLDAARPQGAVRTNGSWQLWAIGGAMIAVGLGTWLMNREARPEPKAEQPMVVPSLSVPVSAEERHDFEQEMARTEALPESLRSTHRGSERFIEELTALPVERVHGPDRMSARTSPVGDSLQELSPRTAPRAGASRQLLFLHGLKLVHPLELYPSDPLFGPVGGGVEARFSEPSSEPHPGPDEHRIPYARFMDEALGKFVSGDRRGCLDDLFIVLGQYPDDVNALFYAGLCCHDLGSFQRAVDFLERARTHSVDSFNEEAEWYHALAYERLHGRQQAQALVERVADRQGYYAARAGRWLAEGPR